MAAHMKVVLNKKSLRADRNPWGLDEEAFTIAYLRLVGGFSRHETAAVIYKNYSPGTCQRITEKLREAKRDVLTTAMDYKQGRYSARENALFLNIYLAAKRSRNSTRSNRKHQRISQQRTRRRRCTTKQITAAKEHPAEQGVKGAIETTPEARVEKPQIRPRRTLVTRVDKGPTKLVKPDGKVDLNQATVRNPWGASDAALAGLCLRYSGKKTTVEVARQLFPNGASNEAIDNLRNQMSDALARILKSERPNTTLYSRVIILLWERVHKAAFAPRPKPVVRVQPRPARGQRQPQPVTQSGPEEPPKGTAAVTPWPPNPTQERFRKIPLRREVTLPNVCPRCKGSMIKDWDWYGPHATCLACGYIHEPVAPPTIEVLDQPDYQRGEGSHRQPWHGRTRL